MTAKPSISLTDARAAAEEAAATTYPLSVAKAHALAGYTLALLEPAEARAVTMAHARVGARAKTPTTPLERLVANACKAQASRLGRPSYSKADLAEDIGLGRANATLLSPAKLKARGLDATFEQAIRDLVPSKK